MDLLRRLEGWKDGRLGSILRPKSFVLRLQETGLWARRGAPAKRGGLGDANAAANQERPSSRDRVMKMGLVATMAEARPAPTVCSPLKKTL